MNFSADVMANLSTLNMYHLRSLEQGHDITQMHSEAASQNGDKVPYRQRLREESVASYELLKGKTMDGLIVACRQHPTNLLLALLPFLAPSRPFAVFSPYKEPLLDAYLKVKEGGKAVAVGVSEAWLRWHQVLPGRTHPEVNMSGGGGYILTGIKVDNSDEVNGSDDDEPAAKKSKE